MKVAKILKGKTIADHISLLIAPGSRQVLTMLAKEGALVSLIAAGARILECACGPCIGMGQSPPTNSVSLRTFNRNFEGRSGTLSVEVIKGPNIKPFPKGKPLSPEVQGKVLTKVGDNITTDHIMPSNAKLLLYRSNIPYLSNYCLTPCDRDFPKKARENRGGFIIGGINYGQGSSREHAALVPLYLGIRAVLAKSFARIHQANLVNNGIIPLVFENIEDYDNIEEMDELLIGNALSQVKRKMVKVKNLTKGREYNMILEITPRQEEIIIQGGLLNLVKSKGRVKE